MERVVNWLAVLGVAAMLCGCTGGGGTTTPADEQGPPVIQFVSAQPSSGSSPLRATFTVNITGGEAPFVYAWDYQNDGAVDRYLNGEYRKTVSVQTDYYLKASDAGGASQYMCVLKVTDNQNRSVTSDPVGVSVLGTQTVIIDPDSTKTYAYSDERLPDGSYMFRSGSPVFFRVAVSGGQMPYGYQWDFNGDGTVDSTVPNPQYTFTLTEPGSKTYLVHLTVADNNGEKVLYDYVVVVFGPDTPPPPNQQFEIILSSSPAASAGVILLKFDPTGGDPKLPTEPRLDLSVVVSPEPGKGGVPPYEYYWDFENDGAIDSQFPSPTIPFYDQNRKILVNPYTIQERQKTFTLRCMVIDGSGQRQTVFRTVLVKRIVGNPGVLVVTPAYGIASGGVFTADPPLPYAKVDGPASAVDALFQCMISGSTESYEWQLDLDGDGNPEFPLIDDDHDPLTPMVPGWGAAPGGGGTTVSQLITFGPYDSDGDPGTPPVEIYPSIRYYPAKMKIRSLDPSKVEVDSTVIDMPLSLVMRNPMPSDVTEGLKKRSDHSMASSWTVQAGGPNGTYLVDREAVVTGGAQGITPMREVDLIEQTFDVPADQGEGEVQLTFTGTTHQSLNFERRGAMPFGFQHRPGEDAPAGYPEFPKGFFVIGGNNTLNGILASVEGNLTDSITANDPWFLMDEFLVPDYYPLTDAAVAYIGSRFQQPTASTYLFIQDYLVTGGLHPPSGSDVDNVSGRLLTASFAVYVDGNQRWLYSAYGEYGPAMVTERYDGAGAVTNNRYYVIGGRVASGQSVATVEAYNLLTNQWENAPSLHDARSGLSAVVISGLIYVYGGAYYPSTMGTRTIVTTAEVFNPQTGVWSYTVPPSLPTDNGAAVSLPTAGAVWTDATPADFVYVNAAWYYGGLDDSSSETNSLEEFEYFVPVPPGP